ncbi:hypothetical protein [Edaphobacter modestus]|uniref:Uncharacterized protein n=1 Tax=Edaphobacter modestus TaxID=388466 RepID=A0A4Q7Y1Q6_9BACT|nr:hypothetical protein [Edaphobacter modestus]RZU29695.1 hypothetical protein BDD14_6300 [Edaphobacter modestus]
MSIEDVLIHYGFRSQGSVFPYLTVAEWVHPTATNLHQRACTVLQFGHRAIVHCRVGTPIYSISAHDVEHLLRREFGCFSSLPTAQA